MKISLKTSQTSGSALIVLTDAKQIESKEFTAALPQLATLIEATQYKANLNEILPLIGLNQHYPFCSFIGLGQDDELNASKMAKLAQSIIQLAQRKYATLDLDITHLPASLHYVFTLALTQANYAFDEYKSKKNEAQLEHIHLIGSTLSENQIELIHAIQSGQNLARDLGNRPGNICYPEYLAKLAQELADEFPDQLKVTVLDEQQMADLGMNAFLAVSQGSAHAGRVITLEYLPNREEAPVVLVGKGVTFDTGGISLKPSANMDEMKFDMCGAASVLGTIRALCEAKLPIHIVGAIAAAENMPSSKATRPGDIVTTMSGQTVEILNTDAEGRLVLCDTLTYIKRFNPAVVVDIATLTGACVVALGKVVSGLFSSDDDLAQEIQTAGEQSFDRVWRLPVMDDYQELLDSPFADIANIGGPHGGAITAACFLQRFTRDYRWAHLDIAGTAWLSGANKGSTGRPVPLLMQFIANRSQHD
ncbi:leucyl aminopeptidase [Acinetobacter sp.]|uniref:leucyl aminopeptidase n=1 Tax=Acinetobacter sp. TaxID=472 RepID=UPI0031D9BAAD